MISFIVIGRNEANWLAQCFKSIHKAFKSIENGQYEIIYVDSDSQDNSIQIAINHSINTILKLTKAYNAAIARNVGASNAKGEFLIFIDADMELKTSFLENSINSSGRLSHDYFSGDIINYYYNKSNEYIGVDYYFGKKISEQRYEVSTGGCFCIKKELWDSVNGMKPYFRRSQDLDFGYRMSKNGHLLLRKASVMVHHHTISYTHQDRVWNIIKAGNFVYRGLLYRENFTNKYIWKQFIRSDYTLIVLLLMCIFSCIFNPVLGVLMYFTLILLRSLLKADRTLQSFFTHIIYYIIRDFQILYGISLFFPDRKPKYDIEYIKQI